MSDESDSNGKGGFFKGLFLMVIGAVLGIGAIVAWPESHNYLSKLGISQQDCDLQKELDVYKKHHLPEKGVYYKIVGPPTKVQGEPSYFCIVTEMTFDKVSKDKKMVEKPGSMTREILVTVTDKLPAFLSGKGAMPLYLTIDQEEKSGTEKPFFFNTDIECYNYQLNKR